ncbi:Peptidase M18 [Spraguea lophii 42_110]|uniref:aspartyl aminopeptidase n=1 Tax=Spraguea lophii (strain 42_110) TaxID=1358809 RepID=S7WDF5_SPRLO|nr:Peptidase M18 [Spraguea lophii 42_110]
MINEYLKFLKECLTPYHLEQASKPLLKDFKKIKSLKGITPGRYYTVLENEILVAFTIPTSTKTMKIYAAHSDSPVLKINPERKYKDKYTLVHTTQHGGGLWHLWYDKPLGIAGIKITKDGKKELISIDRPIAVIPSLPPHLNDGEVYKNGFMYNKDSLNAIMSIADCNIEDIVGDGLAYDLSLVSLEHPVVGGLKEEFIYASRQDNLFGTFIGLKGLEESEESESLNIIAVFADEEIGSETIHGAESNAFVDFLNKLKKELKLDDDINERSIIVSSDVAHAYNPNYSNKYVSDNPVLGKGMVIKNSTRYATNVFTTAILKDLTERYNLPLQYFNKKNSIGGGSTIGPMLVTKLGIKGVDIGPAILSMHSIKEISAVQDVISSVDFIKIFFNEKLMEIK